MIPNKIIERTPPQAIEAEMAVLGAMLIEKEAVLKVMDVLNADDFYKPEHRNLFMVIHDLFINDKAVDAVTVSNELKRRNQLEEVAGGAYITSLINSVSTAANVEYYANIVRDKAVLRQLINTGSYIVDSAFNDKNPAEDILDSSETMLYNIAQKRVSRGFTPISDLIHPTLEYLEKIRTDKSQVPGLRSGFIDLDKMTGGLQPSELVIIAGRPSMGKTAFALNIIEHISINEKKPIALFSLEMSKESLMMRLLCSVAKANLYEARTGFLSAKRWPALTTAGRIISDSHIYIDDSSNLSVLELRARARRLATELKVQKKELSLIVVDYIQMMRGSARTESRQQEIADISRSLKALAKDLRVPVIALSQLSRKTEEKGREGKPQLSDLRESGAIEQDADVVIFIYREGYYKREDPDMEKKATIIIGKQRNGPTGEISLVFEREYTRFENQAPIQMG
jgi:replicative DNA helicase